MLRIEIGTQVIVVLDEEIGLADTNPEQIGLLAEEVVYLRVTIGIDIGEASLTILLLIDRSREQANIAKQIRIIDADKEAMSLFLSGITDHFDTFIQA